MPSLHLNYSMIHVASLHHTDRWRNGPVRACHQIEYLTVLKIWCSYRFSIEKELKLKPCQRGCDVIHYGLSSSRLFAVL